MALFACAANQYSKLKEKGDWSIYEALKTIPPLIHNFTEEFKSVVFERDELEYRDISTLFALCHFSTTRTPIPIKEDKIPDTQGQSSTSSKTIE